MRISDWSSDVCSSDLRGLGFDGLGIVLIPIIVLLHLDSNPKNLQIRIHGGLLRFQQALLQRRETHELGSIDKLVESINLQCKRSEERRGGKECVSTCSSGWSR